MSVNTRNIVVLGGSFAGQAAVHYTLKHIIPALVKDDQSTTYKVVLVDPSSHFWYHVSAPRAMVDAQRGVPHDKTFRPITEGFEQYPTEHWIFYRAEATSIDTTTRMISLRKPSPKEDNGTLIPEKLSYYALVLATGFSTPTPLTHHRGDHRVSRDALDEMQQTLKTAKSVIIAGGGPIGVETAGEIAETANGQPGFFSSEPSHIKTEVTLIAGGPKLLPIFKESRAKKAEDLLKRVGVKVIYNCKVTRVDVREKDQGTTVHLDNGKELTAEVYIPATGVTPNTGYLPQSALTKKGYVHADPHTLHVPDMGPRVYTLGDCGSYTQGGVLDLFTATFVLGANLAKDLGATSVTKSGKAKKNAQGYAVYERDQTEETQLVPIGASKGLGAMKGWSLPGMMVVMFKGKDYMLSRLPDTTFGKAYTKP